MSPEAPDVGDVIRYSYLWWNEYGKGREEGLKERPACVVLKRKTDNDKIVLYVLAITHTRPDQPENGVEIPPQTKQRLGLDDLPSWVITTEYNRFEWVGYDVRQLPSGQYSYGVLPHNLIQKILASFKHHARNKAIKAVGRD